MLIEALPTPYEFYTFVGEDVDDTDPARAQLLIDLAAGLLWLATDVSADPDDPQLLMLVKYAIADMAAYLYISRDDVSASYSPFQSEKIGSYSYSKAASAVRKSVASREPTGVLFFDRVVEYFGEQAYGDSFVSSEIVFHEGYMPLWYASAGLARVADPSEGGFYTRKGLYTAFGNADDDEASYF